MSQGLSTVVDRLQGDWNFIAGFLDDPNRALSGFELSTEEHRALVARDSRSLMRLGLEQEAVNAALSGAHSQRCPGCTFAVDPDLQIVSSLGVES